MQVHRGSYYAWRGRKPSNRSQEDQAIAARIGSVFERSSQRYGTRRIRASLARDGIRVGRRRIGRLMQEQGFSARPRRRRYRSRNTSGEVRAAENRVQRNFTVEGPNRLWAGDITYIATAEGWLFLAVVLDLYSRKVIGWSMSTRIDATLTTKALRMAVGTRAPEGPVIVHSDRGVQYSSEAYRQTLEEFGMIASMSRRGDCYDNAIIETFFARLKTELIGQRIYRSRSEARGLIFEYIEVFYNRQRLHSSLGYMSPEEFEKQYNNNELGCLL